MTSLTKIAKKVTLIHRRNEFRGADESVTKVQELKNVPILTLDGNKNVYDNETLKEWIMLINNFITNNNLNNCFKNGQRREEPFN